MKKKTIVMIITSLIVILLVGLSIIADKRLNSERKRVEDEVLTYLGNKYNENFEVIKYSVEKNDYAFDEEGEKIIIDSSKIYSLRLSSSRLIEFDVVYVEYQNEEEYNANKKYYIMEPGIYENYIYEYKMRDIRSDIREDVSSIINNFSSLSISISDISSYSWENMLISHSLDDEGEKKLYEEYMSFDKRTSNLDFYDLCLEINRNSSLVLNIEVNNYIDNDNVSDFKEEVIELVSYLQDKGYKDYDINFKFSKYESARATRYNDNEKEQIYLIFDYDNVYSDEDDSNKLGAYILDK